MPRGHAAKREKKKAKKKADRPVMASDSAYLSPEVEVVRKKQKPRDEEDI